MLARRPQVPLYGAAVCAVLFLIMLVLAYASARARHVDASALQGFIQVPHGRGWTLTERIAALGDPASVALIAITLAGIAFLRGRPRIAIAVLLLVAATSLSSQLLKVLLAYPRDSAGTWVAPEAFPSGHSTAAMTLAFCGVLVAPARLRPLAAVVGLAFALGVAFGVVSLGWHFPSDVIGGYLLATGWTLVVVSGLLWLEQRRPEHPGRLATASRAVVDRAAGVGLVAAVVVGGTVATLGLAAVFFTRRPDVADFAERHTAAVVVAPAIVLAAVALLAAVTFALRRDS